MRLSLTTAYHANCLIPWPIPSFTKSQRFSFTAGTTPSLVRKGIYCVDSGSLNCRCLAPRSLTRDHSILRKRMTRAHLHLEAACSHLKTRSLIHDHSVLKKRIDRKTARNDAAQKAMREARLKLKPVWDLLNDPQASFDSLSELLTKCNMTRTTLRQCHTPT